MCIMGRRLLTLAVVGMLPPSTSSPPPIAISSSPFGGYSRSGAATVRDEFPCSACPEANLDCDRGGQRTPPAVGSRLGLAGRSDVPGLRRIYDVEANSPDLVDPETIDEGQRTS